jgi:hypothetical protein
VVDCGQNLINAVEVGGGWLMLARIGVMRALNRHVERVFNPDRKDAHWGLSRAVPIAATLVSPNGHMRLRRQPNFVDRSFPVFQTGKE